MSTASDEIIPVDITEEEKKMLVYHYVRTHCEGASQRRFAEDMSNGVPLPDALLGCILNDVFIKSILDLIDNPQNLKKDDKTSTEG